MAEFEGSFAVSKLYGPCAVIGHAPGHNAVPIATFAATVPLPLLAASAPSPPLGKARAHRHARGHHTATTLLAAITPLPLF